jgi:hypothetical protein
LHFGARWGFVKVVSLLLSHGVDATLKDGSGHTPLDLYCLHLQCGRTELSYTAGRPINDDVRFLLEAAVSSPFPSVDFRDEGMNFRSSILTEWKTAYSTYLNKVCR